MTPHQQDIHRIIRTFSPVERERFLEMGGVIPASIQQEPVEWWKPGDPVQVASPITKKMNRETVVKKPRRKRVKVRKVIVMACGSVNRKKGRAA